MNSFDNHPGIPPKSNHSNGQTSSANARSRLLVVVGIALIGCVSVIVYLWRPSPPQTAPEDQVLQKVSDSVEQFLSAHAWPKSPFLNTSLEVGYVGSRRCFECHAEEHHSYLTTAHSRAFTEVRADEEPPAAEFLHNLSSRHYMITKEDGLLYHSESYVTDENEQIHLSRYPLAYRVGSGRFGRTYLAATENGFLVESPVTWYAPNARWNMSPGYDRERHQSFHRSISTGCLFCHTGRVEAPQSDFRANILENNISCERCHGPGELHVKKQLAAEPSEGSIDYTIVNPRHLSRGLSEGICHQCHLQGDLQVHSLHNLTSDYRPGLPFHEFHHEYRLQKNDEQMTIVGHVEQLQQSPCYLQSQSLTCVTCHDPHRDVPKKGAREHFRSVCLQCHDTHHCKAPPQERQLASQDNCVQCHMPSSQTEVPHVAFTHHRIAVHPLQVPTEPNTETKLIPMQDLDNLSQARRRRSLGIGYSKAALRAEEGMILAQQESERLWQTAQSYLQPFSEQENNDAALEVALAELAFHNREFETALRHTERALSKERMLTDERAAALRIRGEIYFQRREYQLARNAFQELTRIRRTTRDWFYLGMTENNLGNEEAAIAALQQALDVDPTEPATHLTLAAIYRARGDEKSANFHQERSRMFSAKD